MVGLPGMGFDRTLGVAGFVVGIVSLGLAIYFWRVSLRDMDPRWSIRSMNLVRDRSERLGEIEVTFEGTRVANLSVSKIMFWNQGRGVINASDIVPGYPLRITGPSGRRVLSVKELTVNNPPSRLVVTPDGDGAAITFDYLGRGHGGVYLIVHDGCSSGDLAITGAIKGADRITKVYLSAGDEDLAWRESPAAFLPPPPPMGTWERRVILWLPTGGSALGRSFRLSRF